MIIAFTGSRIYNSQHSLYSKIYQAIKEKLQELKSDKVISGLALGTDQIAFIIAHRLNIPVIAAIPCPEQDKFWTNHQKEIYQKLLTLASEKIIISPEYTPQCMQIRNEWMTNNSDLLIAVFDGSAGGTKNCVDYAKSINKEIIYINPKEL